MIPIFDSRNEFYRYPTGAVKSDSNVHFKIVLPRFISCTAAHLKITADDSSNSDYLSMYWCGMYDNDHEMWECDYTARDPKIYWYYFEIETKDGRKCINKIAKSSKGHMNEGYNWQLTTYDKNFKTPSWLKGGIMYQIFPDRFHASGSEKKDVPSDRSIHKDWNEDPEWKADENGEVKNSDYFGGDLLGIAKKASYLKSLGVNCVYLNPVFEAHSNHRYNTADYEKIDPLLGTNSDLKKLAKKLKKNGIHLIIDGVFSHTGSDSVYFNKYNRYDSLGAYNSKDSKYYSWFNFVNWPDSYRSWWGFDSLPEIDECNPSYNEFINGKNGIIKKWIKEGISGWRLDVADELPDFFIENLRESAKSEDPDSLIIGEVWEDASNKESYGHRRRFLLGKQLDSVMNYPFRDAVLGFFTGASGLDMAEIICSVLENYPKEVIDILMNIIGTHDTERAITVLAGESVNGRDKFWQSEHKLSKEEKSKGIKLMKAVSAMQFTLPGVPCIYYGDEAGLEGYKDPFNRKCYPWGKENDELLNWYKKLGKIRRNYSCLADGNFKLINVGSNLIVYKRNNKRTELLCAFNSSDFDIEIETPDEFVKGKDLITLQKIEKNLNIPSKGCLIVEGRKS